MVSWLGHLSKLLHTIQMLNYDYLYSISSQITLQRPIASKTCHTNISKSLAIAKLLTQFIIPGKKFITYNCIQLVIQLVYNWYTIQWYTLYWYTIGIQSVLDLSGARGFNPPLVPLNPSSFHWPTKNSQKYIADPPLVLPQIEYCIQFNVKQFNAIQNYKWYTIQYR